VSEDRDRAAAVIELGPNRYGKSAIRVVRVVRGPDRHIVRDLTVAVGLEGDFTAAHLDGDNALVVATDTMKNTTYAFAKEHLDGSIEAFGRVLAEHFLESPQVAVATVSIAEHGWTPIETPGGPSPDAFVRVGSPTRTAVVAARRGGTAIEAGLEDLTLMKTTRSAFVGFPRDVYTTLPEADDRIMASKVSASWRYGAAVVDFDAAFGGVHRTILEVFAEHHSPSVQASIWIIARAILERHAELDEIRMRMPNLHHWLVDLAPFGLANDKEIYVATAEPYGLIEATVRRGG
jgi:urate oxidase